MSADLILSGAVCFNSTFSLFYFVSTLRDTLPAWPFWLHSSPTTPKKLLVLGGVVHTGVEVFVFH